MPIDYKKYPESWKKEIVPRILKRANNRCEFCGLENKSTVWSLKIYVRDKSGRYGFRTIWLRDQADVEKYKDLGAAKAVRVILTVAHLDHDSENKNVKDERLRALCQQCHLKYDAREKIRRISSREVSNTRKPELD